MTAPQFGEVAGNAMADNARMAAGHRMAEQRDAEQPADTTPATVHFGELPPDGRGNNVGNSAGRRRELAAQAAALMDRPGQWARLSTHPDGSQAYEAARRIRTGATSAFRPAGTFEAVGRKLGDRIEVWARYVGGAR